MAFMEPDDVLALSWRNAQVNQSVADHRVLIVHDEPVSEPVKHDFVEILSLDLPVANHAWS